MDRTTQLQRNLKAICEAYRQVCGGDSSFEPAVDEDIMTLIQGDWNNEEKLAVAYDMYHALINYEAAEYGVGSLLNVFDEYWYEALLDHFDNKTAFTEEQIVAWILSEVPSSVNNDNKNES